MMKLWDAVRTRRSSSQDDTEIELTDIDLESGFGDSILASPSSSPTNGVIFGRPAAEERRRLVRPQCSFLAHHLCV